MYLSKDSSSSKPDLNPFPTWTFDKPCEQMDMTELPSPLLSISDRPWISAMETSDLAIIGVFGPETDDEEEEEEDKGEEKEVVLDGMAKELDDTLGGALKEVMTVNQKAFKNGSATGSATPTLRVVTVGSDGKSKTKRYILLGLGKASKFEETSLLSQVGSIVASKCDEEKGVSSCSVLLPESVPQNSTWSHISSSFYSTLYSDNRYRTGSNKKFMAEGLKQITLVHEGCFENVELRNSELEAGKNLAKGIFLTKDIVSAPHNVLNSHSLANVAKEIAAQSNGMMKCTILGKKECEARGMGAYLGVARGSETEPKFIHLTYKPKGDVKKKVGIVGKGLLFDTGGYNIKTAMMELMKFDCGGSAAVLGAARAVAALAPEGVEAHFIVAACENMINEKAYVASDILTASNGKTIEIVNTDAEGRLTLADALVFADKELDCESIIELSTLTGACMVALGQKVAGVWTSNDELADELSSVSKQTGDKSWRMPMESEYNKQLESKIADITNCGTSYGGAITAALFLQNFVSTKKPFAHIDIAGPVWDSAKGATGFGAKMVTEWVIRQGAEGEKKEE